MQNLVQQQPSQYFLWSWSGPRLQNLPCASLSCRTSGRCSVGATGRSTRRPTSGVQHRENTPTWERWEGHCCTKCRVKCRRYPPVLLQEDLYEYIYIYLVYKPPHTRDVHHHNTNQVKWSVPKGLKNCCYGTNRNVVPQGWILGPVLFSLNWILGLFYLKNWFNAVLRCFCMTLLTVWPEQLFRFWLIKGEDEFPDQQKCETARRRSDCCFFRAAIQSFSCDEDAGSQWKTVYCPFPSHRWDVALNRTDDIHNGNSFKLKITGLTEVVMLLPCQLKIYILYEKLFMISFFDARVWIPPQSGFVWSGCAGHWGDSGLHTTSAGQKPRPLLLQGKPHTFRAGWHIHKTV